MVVVPAPGHSATQILLFNRARRWLIMADLAYEAGSCLRYGNTADPYAEHLPRSIVPRGSAPSWPSPVTAAWSRRPADASTRPVNPHGRVRPDTNALSGDPISPYELAIALLGERTDPGEQQSMLSGHCHKTSLIGPLADSKVTQDNCRSPLMALWMVARSEDA